MARIYVATDEGEQTLSENLVGDNVAEDDYATKLIERVRWALRDAEQTEARRRRFDRDDD